MKTKLCDKAKWFLSGIVVGFTCPSLLYSTLLVILASPEGMPNSLGILGRGCLNYGDAAGDAKITVTAAVHLTTVPRKQGGPKTRGFFVLPS